MTVSVIPDSPAKPGDHVGRRLLRFEDPPLLKGRGQFVDDMPVKKGTLHAAFLRSPHAHAEVVSIDYSDALKQPGVFAVVCGADMLEQTDPLIVGFENPIDYRGLALDRVRYVGEPVAVVAATDRYQAEDALDHIKVTYRPLPAVVDPVKASAGDAPILHPKATSNVVSRRVFTHGEPDKAFAEAPRRADLTIVYPRNSVTPMETYAVVAEYLPDQGMFDVLSNFQGPFSVHTVMALALRVKTNKLRHRSPPNSGGSFGSKLTIFPYIVVLCALSRKAGRPVKWIEDRLEHLAAANSAPNRVTKIEAAYRDDGTVLALRLNHYDDHGAYLRAPMPAPIYRMHGLSTNAYDIRHVQVVNNIVVTNKCPTGAVRGFGGPQLYFAIERMLHCIAAELNMDPLELIRRNLVPAHRFPYKAAAGALLDSGDYHRTVEEAVRDGGLDELKRRRDDARRQGRLYGVGYAVGVDPSQSNMGYISTLKTGEERERAGPKDGAVASCTVTVDALGSVTVVGDSVPQGQGHQTALAQIVADVLGLPPEDVTVNLETDTHKDGWSIAAGNYSCRFAPAAASAAHLAATRAREKMARIAAQTLNVPPGEVEFGNGHLFARNNPENKLEFRRVGGLAHWSPSSLPEGMEPAIRESASWSAPELTPTTARDEINTSLAYGFGADFCGVEIDRATGEVRIDKYVSAHDCGTILNPGLAEGQIHGSFASAIGGALYEEFRYAEDGSFLSGTFAEYLIPTAAEMPELTLVHPTPHPSPFTRLGAKGIAECGQYTTPVCLANAVSGALGRRDVTLPLAPGKVLEWIHAAEPPPSRAALQPSAPAATGQARGLTGKGEVRVAMPPERLWHALLDPETLKRTIPGCHELETAGENRYRAVATLGVGPVSGRFDARIQLSDLVAPKSLTLSGDLIGSLGSSRGSGRLDLIPDGEGTRVGYDFEVNISGTVAAVGGRMLQGASRLLIDQFFKNLARQISHPVEQPRPEMPPEGAAGWRLLASFWAWLLRAVGLRN